MTQDGSPLAQSPHTRGFSPVLRLFQVLAIAVSAISPTTSVFLVYGAGLSSAGTGVVWSFVIGAVIALSMAFAYAELGTRYPGAGGTYTFVRNVLGNGAGFVTVLLFLVLGMVVTSTILVASASYLNSLAPQLPVNWTAVAMMAVVTWLSLEKIGQTSWVAGVMLAIELLVITAFAAILFAHPRVPLAQVISPVSPAGAGGAVVPTAFAGVVAAVVPALFAFNGYDWPLYFSEETQSARRVLPRAVLLAVGISILFETVPVIAATLAIPNLGDAVSSAAPLSYIAQKAAGSGVETLLVAGAVIAMFDTGLAGNLAYARIYYASARDGVWPGPINRLLLRLNRHQVPLWGFWILGIGNAVLCYFASLALLITFTGVIIVSIYLLVAVSALVDRVRSRTAERPFSMPFWPAPPVIAIVGVALALWFQAIHDLIITGSVILLGVLYWFLKLRSRKTVPAVDGPAADQDDRPF